MPALHLKMEDNDERGRSEGQTATEQLAADDWYDARERRRNWSYLRCINAGHAALATVLLSRDSDTPWQGRFIMQIRSKALPQSFSLRRELQGFTAPEQGTSHPLLVLSAVVLLALFAIVQIDLHSAQLQATGLLGHGAGIDPVFLSP